MENLRLIAMRRPLSVSDCLLEEQQRDPYLVASLARMSADDIQGFHFLWPPHFALRSCGLLVVRRDALSKWSWNDGSKPLLMETNLKSFKSDRKFSVVSYGVSHGPLLLRSGKNNEHQTRIDVLILDVRAMEIRSWFE